MRRLPPQALCWALYDWANSAFATSVMAGFFPLALKRCWAADLPPAVSTFRLGAVNSAASLLVGVSAPFLGAIADQCGLRKRLLLCCAALGAVATGSLYGVACGRWAAALGLYLVALVGFSGGNLFYDALLAGVAGGRPEAVSALGFSLGYLGGGLLFGLNVAMLLWPDAVGLAGPVEAMRLSFLNVALWWALFTVPLALRVAEPPGGAGRGREAVMAGLRQLRSTLGEIRRRREVALFLVAYWLYIDGVNTVARMAVDFGLAVGLGPRNLMCALLLAQAVGAPATFAFGRLGERMGAGRGVLLGLGVYMGACAWGLFLRSAVEFYALAGAIGLVQGGVQALSRALYVRLIPAERSAQFFGIYNLLGKSAAVLGPLLMGWVALATGSPRCSVLSLELLFALGGVLLWTVGRDGRQLDRRDPL